MARTTGAFFLMGGLLGVLVTSFMPDGPGNLTIVYAAAIAAICCGAVMVAFGKYISAGYQQLMILVATVLITIAIHESTTAIAGLSLASFYVFIACDAAFFFPWRQAAAQIAFAVVCCMLVLALKDGLPWWSGLIAAGASIAVGSVVAILARLASNADLDQLTGLLNRSGFYRALTHEIERAPRTDKQPSLVLINVDRFSAVNQQYGYRAGDEILQQIAQQWQKELGPDEILARLGGDEFAILLPDRTEEEAIALTDRLRRSISIGSSAGVTSWQPGDSASYLVSHADVGLFRAKQAGRNRTILESSGRPPLAMELLEALARETVEVNYQPIVSLADGCDVVGIEALVRWQSKTQPGVTPQEVVRFAEENGLIRELDELVLHRACHDAYALQHENPGKKLILNVNVSGLELIDPEYVSRVDWALGSTGWPAGQLVLEVTESVLDVNTPIAIANLHELRSHGIRIAIDDFGTGYSSLSRLKTLPADYLKLDQSFVAAITDDTEAPTLLEVIALLSGALELPVIAEGVENPHQAEVLTRLGYALAQGFHFGKPQTRAEIAETLQRSRRGTEAVAAEVLSPDKLPTTQLPKTQLPADRPAKTSHGAA